MTTKITPLNPQKRDLKATLEEVKALLAANDENTIQSIYVRITTIPEGGTSPDINSFTCNLFWDDLAMARIELERMHQDYYDQCFNET